MKNYIGCKQIQAKPMNLGEYNQHRGWTIPDDEDPAKPGYLVVYADGYQSWSPQGIFDKAYRSMDGDDPTRINPAMIDKLVEASETAVATMGEKTTVVTLTLPNGFEITESSACVDPANYDEELGASLAMGKIKNQVWGLLGFVLACSRNGM